MISEETQYFFETKNFIQLNIDVKSNISNQQIFFVSKDVFLQEKNLKSKKIYSNKNELFFFKDKIKMIIDNFYLEEKKNTFDIILKQKNFKLQIVFFDADTKTDFIFKIEKFIIKSNFRKEHKILNTIGYGAFSKVYLSERIIKNKIEKFCFKEIEKKNIINNKSFQYLKNEIKILRLIDHKNCLKLHEIYEGKDSIFLVTEYLNGGTLRERMKKKLKNKEATKLTKNLLEALLEINQYNMIHRDIKPENIMFKIKKNILIVKLIDFGLSADFTDLSKDSLLKDKSGTACYIAPEIIGMNVTNQFYNEKVDVFSVGIMLYEILTGIRPFCGNNYKESLLLNFQCNLDYSIIDNPELKALTFALTQKNPEKRLNIKEALSLDIFCPNIKNFSVYFFNNNTSSHQNSLRESLLINNKKFNENDNKENSKNINFNRDIFRKDSFLNIFKKKEL